MEMQSKNMNKSYTDPYKFMSFDTMHTASMHTKAGTMKNRSLHSSNTTLHCNAQDNLNIESSPGVDVLLSL